LNYSNLYNPDLVMKKNEKGEVFLAINAMEESFFLKFNGKNWVKCVSIPYNFNYSDFIINQDGKVEMAFMYSTSVNDYNSIFFLTTDTTYKKWYNPILVQKGGQYYNSELMLINDKYNHRHLIWVKMSSSILQSMSIFHCTSSDGDTWTMPEEIIKNEYHNKKYNYPDIVNLDGEKLLLYWMSAVSNNYAIEYSIYNGNEWLSPVTALENAMYPSMYVDDEGTVHLAYMNQRSSTAEPSQIYYLCNKNSSVSVDKIVELPAETGLIQNYPNPFNGETVIKYKLAKTGNVKIIVYNAIGQEIETIINRNEQAGEHIAYWKPRSVSSGIYYYRLTTASKCEIKKMLYLK
jgi:hypothetical protein